jgi:purine/pyrimidine-nucleoside phosphorylase
MRDFPFDATRFALRSEPMLKHNSYFDGAVQSVGFERNGRRHTLGVVEVGEFHFNTEAPERMTIVSGELWVKCAGAADFHLYPAGTCFEIPAKSGFDVRAERPAGYVCEFL